MLEQTTIKLNETLYRERLHAAAEAREWRASCVEAPGLIEQLRQALGRRLVALGQQLQAPMVHRHHPAKV